ncbi:hypothetical protein ACISK3_13940 [Morganella morganii]|nr:hypothetical protein [Morganella morganii]
MYTPVLTSSSVSQDISVSRFISSTAGGDSHRLIGLLILGVQNTAQQVSAFSPYLSARDIAATSHREFNEAITEADRQQNTRLADTLTQLKFSKDQMTGHIQKIAENHAKPFLRTPVEIIAGEIDLAGLNRLYDNNPD